MIGSGDISPIKDNGTSHFPGLVGIDLHGKEKIIPDSFSGNLNVIVVGFLREHQDPINTWIPEVEALMAETPGLAFYEVPLIYKINPAYRTWINNGMRMGIPDDAARSRTITVYTDREKFLQVTNMQPDRIYVLLLDKAGKILWRAEGPVTAKNLNSLKKTISIHKKGN